MVAEPSGTTAQVPEDRKPLRLPERALPPQRPRDRRAARRSQLLHSHLSKPGTHRPVAAPLGGHHALHVESPDGPGEQEHSGDPLIIKRSFFGGSCRSAGTASDIAANCAGVKPGTHGAAGRAGGVFGRDEPTAAKASAASGASLASRSASAASGDPASSFARSRSTSSTSRANSSSSKARPSGSGEASTTGGAETGGTGGPEGEGATAYTTTPVNTMPSVAANKKRRMVMRPPPSHRSALQERGIETRRVTRLQSPATSRRTMPRPDRAR